ncbi:MAG: carboxymuconolactone decarboxylase family protein [Bacteroidota bacterium]
MSSFKVPTREQVDATSQAIFDNLQKGLGFVPNLYATIGASSNALESFLAFQGAQAKGSFKAKEREAVYLAVSQANGCEYCLAAHTALGKMNGFSEEETIQLRAGTHTDPKLNVITRLAGDIVRTHGRPSKELLDQFFGLGLGQKELIDLVALVSDKTVANYVHNITQIPVDFPAAKPLPVAASVA